MFETGPRLLTWEPKPAGQHVELGISEMNLFLWLSQFGLSAELLGEPLVPIGTVYDPFIARGLDALIYALYIGSQFILVATPSGVTLAPEGGAHQSTVTPSLGIELPNLRACEPAFGIEVGWLLEAAIGGVLADDGFCLLSSALDTTRRAGTRRSRARSVGRGRVAPADDRRWVPAPGRA